LNEIFRYVSTQVLTWLWRHSAIMLYRNHGNRFVIYQARVLHLVPWFSILSVLHCSHILLTCLHSDNCFD